MDLPHHIHEQKKKPRYSNNNGKYNNTATTIREILYRSKHIDNVMC